MHSESWVRSYARAMKLTLDEAKILLENSEREKQKQGYSDTFQKVCAKCAHIRADTKRHKGRTPPEDETKWKVIIVRRYCELGKFTVKKFGSCDNWCARVPNALAQGPGGSSPGPAGAMG